MFRLGDVSFELFRFDPTICPVEEKRVTAGVDRERLALLEELQDRWSKERADRSLVGSPQDVLFAEHRGLGEIDIGAAEEFAELGENRLGIQNKGGKVQDARLHSGDSLVIALGGFAVTDRVSVFEQRDL